MIIAVSMRIVKNPTYYELRDAISHDWVKLLDALSVTPVFIPNVLQDPVEYIHRINARGLLMTGGDNVGPLPENSQAMDYANARDFTEITLLDYAISEKIPIFGVCRGLQLINSYFDGKVECDIGSDGRHVNVQHEIEIVTAPFPKVELNKRWVTNSYHGQGVKIDGVTPEMDVFALAGGGIVEGLYHKNLPVLAVQWHPERDNPAFELDKVLLEGWLAQCA